MSYNSWVLVVHPHALAHGIEAEDIQAAFASGFDAAVPEDAEPRRWLMIGFYTAGRLVELVVVEMAGESYLAIHAMSARKSTFRHIRQAREER
jgi:uncharacterized DUF497 family protein